MHQQRTIGREIGTALAVLAIYLLTILAPLHHARASQLGFEELGYHALEGSWVLCIPNGEAPSESDKGVAKCPANGVGKTEVALPTLAELPAILDRSALRASVAVPVIAHGPQPIAPPSGPRAPPVLL